MDQLRLQFLQSPFLSAALGQIPDKTREKTVWPHARFANREFHWKGGAVPSFADDDPTGADDAALARRLVSIKCPSSEVLGQPGCGFSGGLASSGLEI